MGLKYALNIALAGYFCLGLIQSAGAEGAYKLNIKKKTSEPAEVSAVAAGDQAENAAEGPSQEVIPKPASQQSGGEGAEGSETTNLSVRQSSDPDTAATQNGKGEEDSGLVGMVFQVLSLFGDWGVTAGYGSWQTPMKTKFSASGETLWNEHAVLGCFNLGVVLNLPLFDFLEMEPRLAFAFGDAERVHEAAGHRTRELITMTGVQCGLQLVAPVAQPFFIETGVCGMNISTGVDLATDYSAFEYEGFLLDRAEVTEISLGAGIASPREWLIRLRAGVQFFYQFADFGDARGIRGMAVILFPTSGSTGEMMGSESVE